MPTPPQAQTPSLPGADHRLFTPEILAAGRAGRSTPFFTFRIAGKGATAGTPTAKPAGKGASAGTRTPNPTPNRPPHDPTPAPRRRWLSRALNAVLSLLLLLVVLLAIGPLFLPYRTFAVLSGSMEPALARGSEVIDFAVDARTLRPGDVITFERPGRRGEWVTHRVVQETIYPGGVVLATRGDANATPDDWQLVEAGRVLKAIWYVPAAGYVLVFLGSLAGRLFLAALVLGLGAAFVLQRTRTRSAR